MMVVILATYAGCKEKNTDDPIKTYTFWSGESPPKDVQPIHGKYCQSSHWSKEYIMYMEVKATPLWLNEFIKQNNLVEIKNVEGLPSDAPSWFQPAKNSIIFTRSNGQGSLYYDDSLKGKMFIYEIQL